MKLIYTDEAISDLQRLRKFIADYNPAAANKMAKELIKKVDLLPDFPEIGIAVEMAPDPDSVRDVVFGRYVVRYSVHSDTVIILRIWHGLEDEQ